MAKVSKFYLPKGVKVERPFHLTEESNSIGCSSCALLFNKVQILCFYDYSIILSYYYNIIKAYYNCL